MKGWDWGRVTLGGMASMAILVGAWMVASTGTSGNYEAGLVLIVLGSVLLGAWVIDRVYRNTPDED